MVSTWRSIFAYAWDIAEHGVASSLDEFRSLGLDTVTVAASYHAGKFLRPRGKGKVCFPEDGTIYFRHDPGRYGRIRPHPNSLLEERDVLREICDGECMPLNAWLVLLHNSRIGFLHPESCVTNAFGDRLFYSLCPSAGDARDYARALCEDISLAYPLRGMSLETPGFLPPVHGYHHECALVRPNRWFDNLFGLCFCAHCLDRARDAGIDGACLRDRVAGDISDYLAGGTDYPDDMAEAFWLADAATDRELGAYLELRCATVTSLVGEIRDAVAGDVVVAVIPSAARPTASAWYEGSDLAALARTAGCVEACFYEASVDRVAADLADVRRRLRGSGSLRGILRPSWPDLETPGAVLEAVRLLEENGLDGISFYNWGFLRARNLQFLRAALAGGVP